MPERQLRVLRRRLFIITVSLSVAVILAFALAAIALTITHRNARNQTLNAQQARLSLCQVQNRSNMALREVLLLAQKLVKKAKHVPPYERLRSVQFYAEALRLVPHVNCRKLTRIP